MALIKKTLAAVLQLYLEDGEEIPEPLSESNHKGNIAYRTTPQRHYFIAREARRRNLSLSQTIDLFIDKATQKSIKG